MSQRRKPNECHQNGIGTNAGIRVPTRQSSKKDSKHKMTPTQTKIALRINDDNINHHLWNNRGVWWCHVTVHKPDATAERLRFSLKTRDIEKARTLRDRIFADIQRHFGIAT